MRDDLNAILTFIDATSLTDLEWDSLSLDVSSTQIEIYNGLLSILQARDAVSNQVSRLYSYFIAKGVDVAEPQGRSNIFVGALISD